MPGTGVQRYRGPVTEILVKALAMVAIIALAVGLKRTGLLRVTDFRVLSTLVLWVTLPAALLTAFNGFALDPGLLVLTGLAMVLNTLQQAIGFLLARRHGRREQAFAVINSGSYNIGAFSTPYLAGIIGPHAMIFSTMFDIGGALSTAGSGYAWGTALAEPPHSGWLRRVLLAVFRSPVFVTYLVLVALMVTHLRLPDPVITLTSTVGAANPYLAMTMIGVGLELKLPSSKFRRALKMLAVRYAFALLATAAVWLWLPMAAEIRTIVCMLMFAPMASMLSAFTSRLEMDLELSAYLTSVTILVGIVAMPVVLLLLG